MTSNCAMKLAKFIFIIVLFICFQSIGARGSHRPLNYENDLFKRPSNYIDKRETDLRGIKDVWKKIKEGAINSWNYIKTVAKKTKEKIDKWMEHVKEHASELQKEFKEKLEDLKDKVNTIIKDIYGTGAQVKICMKKEQENMEVILKEILKLMAECIADEINKLEYLSNVEPQQDMNESQFLRDLDNQFDLCERDMGNVNECLCKIKENIFDNFTDMENDILTNHYESRSIIDDVKGALVTCSIDNLINATALITAEIVQVAKCVLEAKENEGSPSA